MIKILINICFMFFIIPAIQTVHGKENNSDPKPVISIANKVFDAGKTLEGETAYNNFKICNRGNAPLNITKIKAACSCTTVSCDNKIIPAGECGNILMEVSTKGYTKAITQKATLYSNDPNTPKITIAIKTKIIPVVSAMPDRFFLNGLTGEKISRRIIIKTKKKEHLALSIKKITIPEKINCKLTSIKNKSEYALNVENLQKTAGTYKGRIILKTNYTERPYIIVPVFGRIMEALRAVPEKLDFGAVHIKSKKLINKNVFIRLNKDGKFKIKKIESPGSLFIAKYQPVKKGTGYKIDIIPQAANLKSGLNRTVIKIFTNYPEKKLIEVPVKIFVK